MFEALRQRQPGQPIRRILWWHFLHLWCWLYFAPMYRYRAFGTHHIPRTGPVLLLPNHQSLFDPILVGLAAHHRQFAAMARKGLFDNPVFGWLIRSLNAISIDQEASDIRAMRQCIEALKAGQALLVYPEGARTYSGETQPFETGTMLLIKRAKPTVVPVAIEGAYDVWPRTRKRPRPWGRMHVMYGEPIPAETLTAMKPEQALEHLRDTVERMRLELRREMSHDAATELGYVNEDHRGGRGDAEGAEPVRRTAG